MDAEQAEESVGVVANVEEDFDGVFGFQYLLVMRLFALPSGPASPPGTLLVAIKHLGVSTPTVIHAR